MRTGQSKEELFNYLTEIDENISTDSILQCGEKINLTLYRGKRGIKWDAIETQKTILSQGMQGKKFNDFVQNIQNLDTNSDISYPDILCMYESDTVRSWDGNITARFYQIDPLSPYEIQADGTIYIPTRDMELTADEYKVMVETRLAFYSDDVIYPLTEAGLKTLNILFDSAGVLRNMETVPVSNALIMAERLADKDAISLVTKKVSDRMKAVITARNSKYQHVTKKDFFKQVFDLLGQIGIYRCVKWSISNEMIIVDLELVLGTPYSTRIKVVSSDIAGIGTKLFGYAKFGRGNVQLFKANKQPTEPTEKLFNGLVDALKDFNDMMEHSVETTITQNMLKDVKDALGAKRVKQKRYFKGTHKVKGNMYDIMYPMIQQTYEPLHEKQADDLAKAYYALAHTIACKEEP